MFITFNCLTTSLLFTKQFVYILDQFLYIQFYLHFSRQTLRQTFGLFGREYDSSSLSITTFCSILAMKSRTKYDDFYASWCYRWKKLDWSKFCDFKCSVALYTFRIFVFCTRNLEVFANSVVTNAAEFYSN